ncbi:MAG: hypothetical protein KAR42_07945 [candidate division Zixibacteria bacterium]|nr:hypothetical protein [candidate division Zixibacteria bacterium]
MNRNISIIGFALLLLFATTMFAQTGEGETSYSLWLGGHYTDFKDNANKVGEYKLQSDKFFPEFKLNYYSQTGSSVFRLDADYFDYENVNGRLKTKVGDKFKAEFSYRSLSKNSGMDLLENMETRELVGANPGGKIITHEFLDDITEFSIHRQEISSKAELLLSRKNDVRLITAHRMIRESGNAQETGSTHCFSCHLGSQSVAVDKQTNSFKAGLEGKVYAQKLAYTFGYRKFESKAPDAYFMYDDARHPVNGGAGAEFGSRVNYEDESLPIGSYPETEKLSHKVSSKGKLGSGHYAAAFIYSRVENKKVNFTNTSLVSEVYNGKVNYTAPLSPSMRLVSKLGFGKINKTDPFIDLAPFREGRSGYEVLPSFDITRYSALDRTTFDGSAELIKRMNPKMTLAFLAGYKQVSRSDYPIIDGDNSSKTMTGQLKFKYRQGLKYSIRAKYRFEKTSDPFTSARGLFERRGREELAVPSGFIYYYQREDLRYQSITSTPTDKHELDFNLAYRASSQLNLTAGFKVEYDKNGDLDSLDVKHSMFQPNLNLTITPNSEWIIASGYMYNQSKSRGPITIALFDG